jgi:hypothetical protein
MPDSTSRLPAHPSLDQLRKQAKELLKEYHAGDPAAAERFRETSPRLVDPSRAANVKLSDAQFVLAREYGFESWAKLVRYIEDSQPERRLAQYARLADDLLRAYNFGDPEALHRLNDAYLTSFTLDALRSNVQKRLGASDTNEPPELALTTAQRFIARLYGFGDWDSLEKSLLQQQNDPRAPSVGLSRTPPFYKLDRKTNTIEPRPPLSARDWDIVFGVIREMGITGLNAGGAMTDDIIERLPELNSVTRLNLGGSTRLSDVGLKHLARMTQLQDIDLSEYPGGRITDSALEFLRHLPDLRRFQMCWQSGISDGGLANLSFCDRLESVDLLGTPTGDGAIRALAGKPKLRRFKTGRLVSDAGLPLLHQFPVFKSWRGGDIKYSLMSADAEPNHLLLDGPFTNEGLASLAGLDGVFALSFFWHISALTAESLRSLMDLPNLGFLGCEGKLCNDEAMRHISAIPRLRMLMAQGTVASDEGFAALSHSQTIEYIWGRECPNLGGPGFAALARMPALKGLAVSCRNVDDASLSALPEFPALKGLMPMDVPDEGFRHVGRCEKLEDLWCMYCRDTGDAATEHIADLTRLKTYYAGATRITDRSLEILGRMRSLESIEFFDCANITNAGIAHLAGLPRLREITIGGSQNITREGMAMLPRTVRANYW